MNTKRIVAVGLCFLILCLTQVSALERHEGIDRYATAASISSAHWAISDYVILARGDNCIDALAGTPLAHKLEAPILLTKPGSLPDVTLKEIRRLKVKEVLILGGTAAVTEKIEMSLRIEGLKITRLGGEDRYATAAQIATAVAPGGSGTVFLVNGQECYHALLAGPYAAVKGEPILLTSPAMLPEVTRQAMVSLGTKEVNVIGNESQVSRAIINTLPKPRRLAEKDDYTLSASLAAKFVPDKQFYYVTTGTECIDALGAGVLAAKYKTGILLVSTAVPAPVKRFIQAEDPCSLVVIGGPKAVSQKVEKELASLLKSTAAGEAVEAAEKLVAARIQDSETARKAQEAYDYAIKLVNQLKPRCREPLLLRLEKVWQEISSWNGGGYSTVRYFTVTFESNGGSSIAVQKVRQGGKAKRPGDPSKEGCNFVGWYADAELSKVFDFSSSITKNTILYAGWSTNRYQVIFESNGGSKVAAQLVEHGGRVIEPPVPEKACQSFVGWFSDGELNEAFDFNCPVTKDLVLYAKWAVNMYTVSFVTDGGSTVAQQSVACGDKALKPADPTKMGYTFRGWYANANLTKKFKFSTSITRDTIVYAKWAANSYIVRFDAVGVKNTSYKTVIYGKVYGPLPTVNREGYTFQGWFTKKYGGLQVASTTTVAIASNHTLYAHWAVTTCLLRYTAGANGSLIGTAEQCVSYGGSGTRVKAVPERGYHFVRWSDGSTANPRQDKNVKADITVEAEFAANMYVVTFKGNGGVPEQQLMDVPFGGIVDELPIVTRENHVFLNWNTAADGTGVTFTTPAVICQDITVFAQWQAPVTISLANIQGITVPKKHGVPVYGPIDTEQYIATITWSPPRPPGNDKFQNNKTYTATITIVPKEGYTLVGVPGNFFEVAGATKVSNAPSSGIVTATFPRIRP